jgi:hypothetical protein
MDYSALGNATKTVVNAGGQELRYDDTLLGWPPADHPPA